MKIQTAKAAPGTNQNSLQNTFNQLTGDGTVSVLNYKTKNPLKQRICECGSAIPMDSIIFKDACSCDDCQKAQATIESEVLSVTRTVRKATKSFYCASCNEHHPGQRMFAANICKLCLKKAQAKSIRERQCFINLILTCTHNSLRGALEI